MKVLAVDYGLKRVGLASGDTVSRIAFPKAVLIRKNDESLIGEIIQICGKEDYKKVIFGLPIDMDGGQGVQYDLTKNFISAFVDSVKGKKLDLEVEEIDERLSSFEAEKYGVDKDKIDMMAAKIILEKFRYRETTYEASLCKKIS